MDETAGYVKDRKPEQPKHEKNYRDCPKHFFESYLVPQPRRPIIPNDFLKNEWRDRRSYQPADRLVVTVIKITESGCAKFCSFIARRTSPSSGEGDAMDRAAPTDERMFLTMVKRRRASPAYIPADRHYARKRDRCRPEQGNRMSIRTFVASITLFALGTPAVAQSGSMGQSNSIQSMQNGHNGQLGATRTRAERRGPTATELNRRQARYQSAKSRAEAEYRRDRRSYRANAMRRHRMSVRRYQQRYARREMAYANAMAAWRRQVSACHRGNRRACNAPSPRVADFY